MSYRTESRGVLSCDVQESVACARQVVVEAGSGPDEAGNVELGMKALDAAGRAGWSVWEGVAACPSCVRTLVIGAGRRLRSAG